MFEVKPRTVQKKESSTETDEGLGSSVGKQCSLGSAGSGSLYLSDSQDWVVSPACSPDGEMPSNHHRDVPAISPISPMLAEETFRYMTYLALEPSSYSHPGSHNLSKVLSADHMEQMTKTYHDMDVVTHLLAERDRDLELAARIGQSLLQRNHLLQERNEAVEEQLTQALDQVHQLQHELSKKDELLRMVASASEESETDSSCSTPLRQHRPQGGHSAAGAALGQLEVLQGKLQDLEEENLALRSEARYLKTETITYEEKEQQLVSDCVKELRETNIQMVSLSDDLAQKNEELLRHQEEIAQLLSQIVELQHRVKELALEKEELRIHLQASKDAQRQLTAELNELAERNAECMGMLHESQEENKELRNRNSPSAGMRRHPLTYGHYPMDSLAAEIEGTMRRELSVEEEETVFEDQRTSQKRVFQAVRSVNASVVRAASATPPIPGSGRSSLVMTTQPFRSTQGEEVRLGQPGSPGSNHLAEALHRLSLRRHNFLCERQFFQVERERKLQALAGEEGEGSVFSSPMGSGLSSSSNLSELSFTSGIFKTFLPEKLQIVKPMEGSLTLHHWQQLAQPHLGTILDPHPGVVTKGFRPLPQDAVYHLTDLEEDEEDQEQRGRRRKELREKGSAERGKGEEEEEEQEQRGQRRKELREKGSAERGKGEEEDQEQRGQRRKELREKGSAERGKGEEEEEEDEEEDDDRGITFKVHCSSTPRDRKRSASPPPISPLTPTPGASPKPPQTTSTTTVSDLTLIPGPCNVIWTSSLSPQPVPVIATTPVQSQSQFGGTTMTTTATTVMSCVHNPGKSQSSTLSTYTFTTCRILHPSDVTQVTSSYQSQPSGCNTPSSMRTGPSTPVTPCRLSLGDSFPPHRPAAAPCGLAKLVLERGISAQVSTETPPASPKPGPRQSLSRLLPSTPPNSPSHSPAPSPVPFESRPVLSDNFLASRPAELFLQDVYGVKLGRAQRPSLPSPSPDGPALIPPAKTKSARKRLDPVNVNLVERLRRLGFTGVGLGSRAPPLRQDSSTFVAAGGGSLLDGLRRNQSLPALIGACAGASAFSPAQIGPPPPPPHPTSLALATPPWGDLSERRRRRPASLSHPPPPSVKR